MKWYEKEILSLKDEIVKLESRIRDLEKNNLKFKGLLELSGVRNKESQERGLESLVETVMGLPYLEASTMLGRAGELKRLGKKLVSYKNKEVGYSVPNHLRPSNFARSLTNRREAEEMWDKLQKEAQKLLDSELLSEEEWERVCSEEGFCDLLRIKTFLRRLPEVTVFEEKLTEVFCQTMDGILVPEEFVDSALHQIKHQIEMFKFNTNTLPTDWTCHMSNIIYRGFIPNMTTWEAKGLTKEEWEEMGDFATMIRNVGYEEDFWYYSYMAVSEYILHNKIEKYKAALLYLYSGWKGKVRKSVILSHSGDLSLVMEVLSLDDYLTKGKSASLGRESPVLFANASF